MRASEAVRARERCFLCGWWFGNLNVLLLLLPLPFFCVFAVFYVGFIRFRLLFVAFCCVFAVFYVGFMACSLPLSSFVLCFTWVLSGSSLVRRCFAVFLLCFTWVLWLFLLFLYAFRLLCVVF